MPRFVNSRLALAAIGLAAALAVKAAPPDAIDIDLTRAFAFNQIHSYTPTEDGVEISVGAFDPHFSLPLKARIRKQKLRLEFRNLVDIHTLQIFYGFDGRDYSPDAQQIMPAPRLQRLSIDVPLPDGNYHSVRIDLESLPQGGQAHLLSARVLPLDFTDGRLIVVLLTLLAGVLTIAPGLLLYALAAGPRATAFGFAAFGFAGSVLWGVGAWLVMWAARRAGVESPGIAVCLASAAALGLMLALFQRLHRWRDLARLTREAAPLLVAWFLALGTCAFIVTHSLPFPVHNLIYNSVSGPKTFGAFRAHDNLFQFENARALADDIPLSEPYQRGRLVFQPEDREILPGVVYAPVFAAGTALAPEVGRSYLLYTLLGTAFNLMVLWPLAFLLRRYYRGPVMWALLATGATAFALVNSYLTWFKFAGAALFLSGLIYLLREDTRFRHWLGAGALFGLAANMHSSAALGLPLVFLWLAWRELRAARGAGRWIAALAGPAALAAVFVVLQVPWAWVKAQYFHDQQNLMKSFFIAGKSHPDGLLASVRLFFESIPLADQIAWRLNRLRETWQLHELGNLFKTIHAHGWHEFLLRWNRMEFGRTSVLFYPVALFSGLALLARKKWPAAPGWCIPVAGLGAERRALVWLSFATLLLLIVLAYGSIPPYVPHAQPMALLLVAYGLLSAGVLAAPRAVGMLFGLYVLASAVRLGMFL